MEKATSANQARKAARVLAERTRQAAAEISVKVAETRRQIDAARRLMDGGSQDEPAAAGDPDGPTA